MIVDEAALDVGDLAAPDALARPLCVDLDGTLIHSDTLWESVLLLLRAQPWVALLLPLWLLQGRARFKRHVAERIVLDPAALPYRQELVLALQATADRGRLIVLATAADEAVARAVAGHLTFFHDVIASDGTRNVKGAGKRETLETRYGQSGFDYIGDSAVDLTVFEGAARAYLVGATRDVAARARRLGDKLRVVSTRRSPARAAIKVLRVHQWSKNLLVFVPALLAPGLPPLRSLVHAAFAFVALSLCASAGYVFNDLVDVAADRAHETKRRRPFASGALPLTYGPPILVALLVCSFGLAFALLPIGFVAMLALYLVLTLSYSFYLKSKLMIDVIVLAWLYTHRVVAGGIATAVPVSEWLLAFSMFIFFSLAFCKRYIELRARLGKDEKIHSRGYYPRDVEMVSAMGPTAGYLAVLVFCLYIESGAVAGAYRHFRVLWLVCPVLFYWISRIWFVAHRGQLVDDPVKYAITDRHSWACAFIIAVLAGVARFWR